MDLLEQYCRDDVAITRDLYLFGLGNGFLRYKRKGGKPTKSSSNGRSLYKIRRLRHRNRGAAWNQSLSGLRLPMKVLNIEAHFRMYYCSCSLGQLGCFPGLFRPVQRCRTF